MGEGHEIAFRCTPQAAKDVLALGNEAYVRGGGTGRRASAVLRTKLVQDGQHPYAVIVTCCDSRVQPVSAFSAQLGDLFVTRTIGGYVGPVESASVEYGVAHLGAPLVVVLGHTHCGAVQAALEGGATGNIAVVVDDIAAAVGDTSDPREAERRNVRHSIERLLDNEQLRALADEGRIEICGAMYDLSSGVVTWL
ncbi:MAG: carbonic anhydrase [Coriobacteriia bacterium]|nr:carbonic anhydrase [Coriobacteriia bacterium]MBS5477671.1 carbonic anhydrase [Coriobacteriia bacterium]